jgi:hypothetical protein
MIYKNPRRNFLNSISNEGLAAWIIPIGSGLIYFGFIIDTHSNDVQNYELKQSLSKNHHSLKYYKYENKRLSDRLLRVSEMQQRDTITHY